MLEKRPPYLPDKLHANHPRQPFPEPAKAQKEATLAQPPGGSELDAKTTPQGVTIARDFTVATPQQQESVFEWVNGLLHETLA